MKPIPFKKWGRPGPYLQQVTSFGAAVPLVVAASPRGGRGVFAGANIAEGQEVEVCGWDIYGVYQNLYGRDAYVYIYICICIYIYA